MVFSKIIGVEILTARDRLLRSKLPEPRRLRNSSSRWSIFIHLSMKAMPETRFSVSKTLSSGSHCKQLNVVFSFCIIPPMQVSSSSYRAFLMICLSLTTHHQSQLAPQPILDTQNIVSHLSKTLMQLKEELRTGKAPQTPFMPARAPGRVELPGMRVFSRFMPQTAPDS